MMIDTISRQTIDEQLQTIGRVLYGIERGGGVVHLRDLGLLLIEATGLLERNPGLVAAADDLYAAAEAVVRDSHKGAQPIVRKLRLFRAAHERFSSRMRRAGVQIRPERLNSLKPAALQPA
jgi:hypothetical protein